jgi:hypothetical protein
MAFTRDDYVVRTGSRGFWLVLLGVLGWTALTVGAWLANRGVATDVVLVVFEVVFIAECARRARLAIQRKVVFAVYSRGIFFGGDGSQETVPWSRICAVEFFNERVLQVKSQTIYHCVGVRSLGTAPVKGPGNGHAAQPVPGWSIPRQLNLGRADLIPGGDGTVRHAYRRMDGWRVNQARLTKAVHRYAPAIPVIDGPDYPASLSQGEALQAKGASRSFSR